MPARRFVESIARDPPDPAARRWVSFFRCRPNFPAAAGGGLRVSSSHPFIRGETATLMRGFSEGSADELKKMRRLATGAFVVVFIGMIVLRMLEQVHPSFGFPRAFCEAATVGALADWFAVVALFRHPLGVPIPHTAILPRNKDRVAESLAQFVVTSFLTEEQLGPSFRSLDYARFASWWLKEHSDLLVNKAASYAPRLVAGLSDEAMAALLAERARAMVMNVQLGPLAAEGLRVTLQDGRDREIYSLLLKAAEDLILSNRELIQAKIREEIPVPAEILRSMPGFDRLGSVLEQLKDIVASTVATRTIEKIQNVLAEARRDLEHNLWKVFTMKMGTLIENVRSSPETGARIRAVQRAVAASSLMHDFSTGAWSELKAFLLRDCAAPDSTVRARLREAVSAVAEHLEENAETREEINAFLGEEVLKSVLRARPFARNLIVATVQNWNVTEMAGRLEATVGRDLQFIRLNGTVIGGLVGLLIHAGYVLLGN
jgi:uncharacterized membrane-anchored protein YjiN (DUF445 family)